MHARTPPGRLGGRSAARSPRAARSIVTLAALVTLALLGSAAPAAAHGVLLDSEDRDGAVVVQAVYDNGDSMHGAQVTVLAPGEFDEPYATGTIDAQGNFLFAPSEPGLWNVEVRDAGHGNSLNIDVDESALGGASAGGASADGESAEGAGESADLTEAVEASDIGFSPLQLAVMSALGVWGLVGTALFFRARRKGT